ncbi:MAG: hypothetical protein WAX04_11680 [Oscillospiraceae bacterium]
MTNKITIFTLILLIGGSAAYLSSDDYKNRVRQYNAEKEARNAHYKAFLWRDCGRVISYRNIMNGKPNPNSAIQPLRIFTVRSHNGNVSSKWGTGACFDSYYAQTGLKR